MNIKRTIFGLTLIAGISAIKAPAAITAEASDVLYIQQPDSLPMTITESETEIAIISQEDIPSLKSETTKYRQSRFRHFTWGFDVGASIDLSGNNMSTFDAETYFGYKGSWVRTAAIGAGIHKAFGNKYTFIPLYGILRTSFRSKPSLFFFELKAGYSFNTLSDSGSFGGAYGSIGVGINLAMSKSFQSHIILSYGYFTLHNATDLKIPYEGDNINSAVLKFGINF